MLEKAVKNVKIIKRFREEVEHMNETLGQTEKVKKVPVAFGPWSIAFGRIVVRP